MFMHKSIHTNQPKKPVRFLLFAGLLFVSGFINGQKKSSVTPAHPNILIIITDQQTATMLSCTGNKWLHTPAMDGLASAGVRFEKAYVTNPVCLPSRFSIQTGMLPSVAGIRENDVTLNPLNRAIIENLYPRSLGNTFRKAGYDTYYGGKLHVPLENRNPAVWGYNVLSKDDRGELANNVSDFLLHRNTADKPFLLFASFINPHDICFDAIRFGDPDGEDAKATPPDLFEVMKIPEGISRTVFTVRHCPLTSSRCWANRIL